MNNKTNHIKGKLTTPEEDLVLEEAMQKSNIDSGLCDNWIFENHDNLVSEFIGENSDKFYRYCKERYKEVKK